MPEDVASSWTEAKKLGLKRYYTGKPCKHGHICEASLSSGCLECRRIKSARDYSKNPRKILDAGKRWRANNPDKLKDIMKAWRDANPDKIRANNVNRKALKRNADGTHTASDIRRIEEAQKLKCASCSTSIKKGYHVDHIQPLSKGGTNWPENIQLLCQSCNLRKYAMDPFEWANKNGRLL